MRYEQGHEDHINQFWRQRCAAVAAALRKNGFAADVCETGAEVHAHIRGLIADTDTVGRAGSITLSALGIYELLRDEGITIIDPYKEEVTPEESLKIRKDVITADVLLTSTNAVTDTGELVNVDGTGNRVAGMIFGPKKTIIVAGRNKIVSDVHAGIDRIKKIAAPMNAQRLGLGTPCVTTGHCTDCAHADRICNVTVIMNRCPSRSDIHVVLVNEDLGF